jgi:hypothetical protein
MAHIKTVPKFYTLTELIELRRQMLRYARSVPRGPERNERRQIADSLRRLFKNKDWLKVHLVLPQLSPQNSLSTARMSNSGRITERLSRSGASRSKAASVGGPFQFFASPSATVRRFNNS